MAGKTDSKAGQRHDRVGGERLQRYLARCGVASRRAAEELIVQGRVDVNGETADVLGVRVVAGRDEVRVDGERIAPPTDQYVILLNKPDGVLCSRDDPESRRLVYTLLPQDTALRSIGRLDFHTEGVLLFTNDGDLAERLAHPRFGIERVYEARVRGVPTPETLARLVRGVILEDGPARVISAELIKQTDRNGWVKVTLQEGRNREVRRILERVGHPVMRLRRVSFAGLTTTGLQPGRWRTLTDEEVNALGERGHVGAFALPPDPRRRKVQAAGVAEAAAAPRKRELPPRPKLLEDGTPGPRRGELRAQERAAAVAKAPARGAGRGSAGKATTGKTGTTRSSDSSTRSTGAGSRSSGAAPRAAGAGSRSSGAGARAGAGSRSSGAAPRAAGGASRTTSAPDRKGGKPGGGSKPRRPA